MRGPCTTSPAKTPCSAACRTARVRTLLAPVWQTPVHRCLQACKRWVSQRVRDPCTTGPANAQCLLAARPVAYLQWGRSQGGEPSACQALQTPCALLCAGQHAVALAAGYLDPAPAELVRALRKQVVVVVTAGWDVLCYDHNLRLKWQASVKVTWGRQRNAMGGCMLGDAAP